MNNFRYEMELATDKMEGLDITFHSFLKLQLSKDKKKLHDRFGAVHFEVHNTFIQFFECHDSTTLKM